jgi:hypothetical protein
MGRFAQQKDMSGRRPLSRVLRGSANVSGAVMSPAYLCESLRSLALMVDPLGSLP